MLPPLLDGREGTARGPEGAATTEAEALAERMRRYDAWRQANLVPHASRVVPVDRAVAGQQWVLPSRQLIAYLTQATVFALGRCGCRERHRRCDRPLETCFVLDDLAERRIAAGTARRVSLDEAERTSRLAQEHGLVHLAIYVPDHHFEAVCSCCPCCCHDLQIVARYGRGDLIARSDYVAGHDAGGCDGCGRCVARCPFGAIRPAAGGVALAEERCYGCGLCVGACAAGCLSLRPRRPAAPL
jgi:ferredoxin